MQQEPKADRTIGPASKYFTERQLLWDRRSVSRTENKHKSFNQTMRPGNRVNGWCRAKGFSSPVLLKAETNGVTSFFFFAVAEAFLHFPSCFPAHQLLGACWSDTNENKDYFSSVKRTSSRSAFLCRRVSLAECADAAKAWRWAALSAGTDVAGDVEK